MIEFLRDSFFAPASAFRVPALRKYLAIGVALLGVCAFAQTAVSAGSDPADRASGLGKLTPFYRATQLQGHIIGGGLEVIPAYLLGNDIDLKYRKNPQLNEEVPFADTFNIARFLGGYRTDWLKNYGNWSDALGNGSLDYVVKGANGALTFRSDMIARRLKPYLDAGYKLSDITLSIENTPWAIARDGGKEGVWGQVEPPADWGQWQQTLQNFALDIKKLYGPSAAPNFKMGVEYDARESFDGSESDYLRYYSIGYAVFHKAFPGSAVVPAEFTGNGTCANADKCVFDEKDFVDRANAAGDPPSYIPRSLNSFQFKPNITATATISRAVASYSRFGRATAEIHQFGLLGQPFASGQADGAEEGPREAAWEFIVLMGLREQLHPQRVFHWKTFYVLPGTSVELLNGTGFLDLALDRYLGMDMTRLPVVANGGGVEAMAIAFQSRQRKAIIVATSDPASAPARAHLQIDVGGVFAPSDLGSLRAIGYSEDNNVFLQIRSDLAAQNNLKPEFNSCPYCTGDPDRMAVDRQRLAQMLNGKSDAYVAAVKSGLRFHDVAGNSAIKINPQNGRLDLDMRGNELLILETRN